MRTVYAIGTTVYDPAKCWNGYTVLNAYRRSGRRATARVMQSGEEAAGACIRHYHFNESNHATHGTGHAPFKDIVRTLKAIGYEGYLAFYMPQTSQAIFRGTPGIGYGKMDAATAGNGGDRKTLQEYLAQPLRLLKMIEATVEAERDFYEYTATRY